MRFDHLTNAGRVAVLECLVCGPWDTRVELWRRGDRAPRRSFVCTSQRQALQLLRRAGFAVPVGL